jgi:capsular exopolysaccharide synthesis family protein
LSEVLTGQTRFTEAIVKLEPSGLHLLPGGAAREDVAELLSGPRFGRLLDEARKHFDYIIIDAPPLGVFTDANLLINRADSAILVVRAYKTRYAAVDRLLEQLPRERMLGVVLNRADIKLDENAYYYAPRQLRLAPEAVTETEVTEDQEAANEPGMIYIEEDVLS